MHFERLRVSNLLGVGGRECDFRMGTGRLRKWTVLPAGPTASCLLRALALAGLGRQQWDLIAPELLGRLPARPDFPAQIEVVQVRHAPQERGASSPSRRHVGCMVDASGSVRPLPKAARSLHDPAVPFGRPELGKSHVGRLVLGCGSRVRPQSGTDCFDILPDQRWKRCAGLFDPEARLTDPLAFLQRLRQKGTYRDGRARALMARLNADLHRWLDWKVGEGPGRNGEFDACWQTACASERAVAAVCLDIARHALDASARLEDSDPLRQPGVVLLDQPDRWADAQGLARLFGWLDARLPQLQFVVALAPAARRRFPVRLLARGLDIPEPVPRRSRPRPRVLSRGTVLLVDVDGTLPNLALMKLSRHWKSQGRKVALARGVRSLPRCDTVFASCVFNTPASAARLDVLRGVYGGRFQAGGSGVDLHLRLAPSVEALPADYGLYPELGDRALGFLTRGCPQRCPFCVVPVKEGPPRQVSDLESVLQGRRRLILLDDNLLAHPAALPLLEEMARRDLAVNFNQTLDLRRLTPDSAWLLRRIRCSNARFTRPNYHFSLNDARGLDQLRERYALLQASGRDNVEFVCMYGFNTSLAEDVKRFRFLRSLPGAYVFVQRYRPLPGGPAPDLAGFFDEQADALLDELVRIVFRQNMKSMETYYRWLALQYASQRGRIHHGLVETLFRYNGRQRMGGFLHRLQQLSLTHRDQEPDGNRRG